MSQNLIRDEFNKHRDRDARLWEDGYERVFRMGWSACIQCVTPEARKVLSVAIARCIAEGKLPRDSVEALHESLLGPLANETESALNGEPDRDGGLS